jgi:S-DNA-T family DNA segregation ATPase FtsK/SpoIIIE
VLVIDNYGSFRQMTEDAYEELIEKLAGEGLNYGFYLIITALNGSAGEIPGKLFEKLKTTLCLEMSDKFGYGDVLRRYRLDILPEENRKGRGLCCREGRILEFQVPLFSGEDDYGRIRELEKLGKKQKALALPEEIPEKFPSIPLRPEYGDMMAGAVKVGLTPYDLLIGYEERSGYVTGITLQKNETFLISGSAQSGRRSLLGILMRELWEKGIRTVLTDRRGETAGRIQRTAEEKYADRLCILDDSKGFAKWYELKEQETVLCISDLSDFVRMLQEKDMLEIREDMAKKAEEGQLFPLIALTGIVREMALAGDAVFELILKNQCGIHLGGNAANQHILEFEDYSYMQLNQWEKPGIGYLKTGNGSATRRIRLPLPGKEKIHDTSGCTGSPGG